MIVNFWDNLTYGRYSKALPHIGNKFFLNPTQMNQQCKEHCRNLVAGRWQTTGKHVCLLDPLNGTEIMQVPDTDTDELEPFVESLKSVPKYGLHNPIYNTERYLMLGEVFHKASILLSLDQIRDHFAMLIQRVMPKSYAQCVGEVDIIREALKFYSGDSVRFHFSCSEGMAGDCTGERGDLFECWPFGPVLIIAPFNFPLEIPALQLIGALAVGNKPLLKTSSRTPLVMEHFLRLLHECGLPMTDVDLIHISGSKTEHLFKALEFELYGQRMSWLRNTQITGSSETAEIVSNLVNGKVRIEDAGFDWKVIGPDVDVRYLEQMAWQCDMDAYSASGQKCSAQSFLAIHENWYRLLVYKLAEYASKRNVADLTLGPVLSLSTEEMLGHINAVSAIPGAGLLFGGKALEGTSFATGVGAIEPTAVYVPLSQCVSDQYFELITTEIFGPFQIITRWSDYNNDSDMHMLGAFFEKIPLHLTAGIVAEDSKTQLYFLGHSVNGTAYVGNKARTSNAPSWMWFGPSGDPRSAGIGTPRAIKRTWCTPRQVTWCRSADPDQIMIKNIS